MVFIRCQWCLTDFKKHLIHWFLWVFSTIGLCLWKILKRPYLLIAFIQHPFFVKLHLTSKLHVSWYPQTESVNGRGQRAQLSCAQIQLSVFSVHLSFRQWNDYSDIAFELVDGEKKKNTLAEESIRSSCCWHRRCLPSPVGIKNVAVFWETKWDAFMCTR